MCTLGSQESTRTDSYVHSVQHRAYMVAMLGFRFMHDYCATQSRHIPCGSRDCGSQPVRAGRDNRRRLLWGGWIVLDWHRLASTSGGAYSGLALLS